jgi:hypothetical protein
VEEEAIHLLVDRKQRKKGNNQEASITFKGMPHRDLISPDKALPPKVPKSSQNSTTSWGPKIQHMSL